MNKSHSLTDFFKCKTKMNPDKNEKKRKNRSLTRSESKIPKIVNSIQEPSSKSILLDSDSADSNLSALNTCNSSDESIISLFPLSPCDINNQTPIKDPQTSQNNTGSSSSGKYYSPNKKRLRNKQDFKSVQRNLNSSINQCETRQKPSNEKSQFVDICEGYDDNTKSFLHITYNYLNDSSMLKLLDKESTTLLSNIMLLHKPGATIVYRLFWRREGWYKREWIFNIVDVPIDNKEAMLNDLVRYGFLEEGTIVNMTEIEDYTDHLLKLEDVHNICKTLKMKKVSKKESIEKLKKFSQLSNISSYFTKGPITNNRNYVLKLLKQHAGHSYRLSAKARATLHRLYILSYIGIDYAYIRDKRLVSMLHFNNLKLETFPIDDDIVLDKPSLFFHDNEEFEQYVNGREMYEIFLKEKDSKKKCEIVNEAYMFYQSFPRQQLNGFSLLPEWLRRYTPTYLYVKIMEEGIADLKKGKNSEFCKLAVDILNCLIEQNLFRQHKKANWIDEKALILHHYLHSHDEAAKVLLDGFNYKYISEQCKDALRPRALKIAKQKNIKLNGHLKEELLRFGSMRNLHTVEGTIPSHNIHKQAMENNNKGKAKYETRNEKGLTVHDVESYAMNHYIENYGYTHGGHWEGRIIVNIFYLLFWDIIYDSLPHIRGIYLSRYQRFPLDLYSGAFYENRREVIEKRLKFIESGNIADVIEAMRDTWNGRSPCEISELTRDITINQVTMVAECLGSSVLSNVCRRLAVDYRYCHSGFPDLTLYNDKIKRIKFVEVKSDNDSPSLKQIQWMRFLLENGIETEFCYVGTKSTARKSRKPVNECHD